MAKPLIVFLQDCKICDNFEHVQGIVKVNDTVSEIVLNPDRDYSLFMIQ